MGKKVEIPNYLTQTMEKRQRSGEVDSKTVKQSNRKLEPDTISTKKTSFYLTPAQLLKLDRLANSLNEESGGEIRPPGEQPQ